MLCFESKKRTACVRSERTPRSNHIVIPNHTTIPSHQSTEIKIYDILIVIHVAHGDSGAKYIVFGISKSRRASTPHLRQTLLI
mmetsp:Transcript_1637/g.2218  ORF Transcript_1637/g.2218 Transcript_1637/m.2218 type:complete len:83 (+) Transcript_1637:18-266(+)